MNEEAKMYLKNIENSIKELKEGKENKHKLIDIINTELKNCGTKNEKEEVFNKFFNCFLDIRHNLEHKNREKAEDKSKEIFSSSLYDVFWNFGEKERKDAYLLFSGVKGTFYLNKMHENVVYITTKVKTSPCYDIGNAI